MGPDIQQQGITPVDWIQILGGTAGQNYAGITVGPDKNVWFVDTSDNGYEQVKMNYLTHFYSFGGTNYQPYGIATGADGKFYVNTASSNIIQATTTGTIALFAAPSLDTQGGGITLGPDGNVWFVEHYHIGKITTAGTITEYSIPSHAANAVYYGGITTGPDGNLWFSEDYNGAIAKVVPATGAITEYSLSTQGITNCYPGGIANGSDGNLWVACSSSNLMLRVTTAGVATSFNNAWNVHYSDALSMTTGPDGNPWFVGYPSQANGIIGEILPVPNGDPAIVAYSPPAGNDSPFSLVAGPDLNIWATTGGVGKIDVYIVRVLTVTPSTLTFTATGQTATLTVAEPFTTHWIVNSLAPAIASVAAGSGNNHFVVTAKSRGRTRIQVKDSVGNNFFVVTVVQ
jgi:streptogramin lyase